MAATNGWSYPASGASSPRHVATTVTARQRPVRGRKVRRSSVALSAQCTSSTTSPHSGRGPEAIAVSNSVTPADSRSRIYSPSWPSGTISLAGSARAAAAPLLFLCIRERHPALPRRADHRQAWPARPAHRAAGESSPSRPTKPTGPAMCPAQPSPPCTIPFHRPPVAPRGGSAARGFRLEGRLCGEPQVIGPCEWRQEPCRQPGLRAQRGPRRRPRSRPGHGHGLRASGRCSTGGS